MDVGRRRGLSEISGAIILAVAAIGIGSITAQKIITYTLTTEGSFITNYRRAAQAEGQLLSIAYSWKNVTHTSLLLYNYGWQNITIQTLFLDGNKLNQWSIEKPVIQPRELVKLAFPGTGQTLSVVTQFDRVLTFKIA